MLRSAGDSQMHISMIVRGAGIAGANALGFWCVAIGIVSFLPEPAGPGLPTVSGGAGFQIVVALVGIATVGLVAGAAFVLGRPPGAGSGPVWLIVAVACWAAGAAIVAASAQRIFLAPEDFELGIGAGVPSTAAPTWAAYFWIVAAVAALLAALLAAHRLLAQRSDGTDPAAATGGGAASG